MTLLDPTYAEKHVPIIASVSEHQSTSWSNYHFDIGPTFILVPMGIWLSLKSSNERVWFLGILGVFAGHFSAVMVRLMLVLAPASACLAGLAASEILRYCVSPFVKASPGQLAVARAAVNLELQQSNGKLANRKRKAKTKGGYTDDPKPMSDGAEKDLVGEYLLRRRPHKIVGFLVGIAVLAILFKAVLGGVWASSVIYSNPSITIRKRNIYSNLISLQEAH